MDPKQRLQLVVYIVFLFLLFSNVTFHNIFFQLYSSIFNNNSIQDEYNNINFFGKFLLAILFAIIILLLL